ncbi:MAG: DUF4886 domain-containing protein [Bacteroidales bacterium]|nr:DUF4886 domain-containing protein [Bacteroidales bacterium]
MNIRVIPAAILVAAISISCSSPAQPASLSVNPETLSFDPAGETHTVLVTTSASEWSAVTDLTWLTLTRKDGGILEVKASPNNPVPGMEEVSKARSGAITIHASSASKIVSVSQEAVVAKKDTVRILAIGNSFSTDAVEQYLYGLLKAAGVESVIGNMYHGSCTLKMHADYAKNNSSQYEYHKIVNGVMTNTANSTLLKALKDEKWDIITVQEGGGFHGYYNLSFKGTAHSMEPDLTNLIAYIKANCLNKDVKIGYHSPWAAQKTCTDAKFQYYGNDQDEMYRMICTAATDVMTAHPEIEILFNSMDAIQNGRTSYLGDTFNRDGWHLSLTIGRYAVGCLWCEIITGKSVVGNTYHGEGQSEITGSDIKVCQQAAHQAALFPKTISDLSYIGK